MDDVYIEIRNLTALENLVHNEALKRFKSSVTLIEL